MLRKLTEHIMEDELDDVLKPIDPDVHAKKKAEKEAKKKLEQQRDSRLRDTVNQLLNDIQDSYADQAELFYDIYQRLNLERELDYYEVVMDNLRYLGYQDLRLLAAMLKDFKEENIDA